MQPTGTVWTTLIGDHPGIIPVKFSQNPHGRRTPDIEWSQKLIEHFVLRWAKKYYREL